MNEFEPLFEFEREVASFFGAPYAVAVDCCTHALELCLRLRKYENAVVPKFSYISVPFMMMKINQNFNFINEKWENYYHITEDIIDSAAYWKEGGYISSAKMCLSFHYKKHLNLGRGGMILLDNLEEKERLIKMRYDGRSIYQNISYKNDNISSFGFHYYMTPEEAIKGLEIFKMKKHVPPAFVSYLDYSDLTNFSIFKSLNLRNSHIE